MKRVLSAVFLIAVGSLALAGCGSKAGPPVSTATGKIAPSTEHMTQAQLQASYMRLVPRQAMTQPIQSATQPVQTSRK